MFMTNFSYYVPFSVFLVQAFVWPSLGAVNSQRRWRNKSRRGMQRGLSIRLFIRGGRIYRRRPKSRRTHNGTGTKRCPKTMRRRKPRRRSQTGCCCSKSSKESPVLRIPRTKRLIRRKRNFKNRKKTLKRERQRTKYKRKRRWMKSEIYQSQRWSQP